MTKSLTEISASDCAVGDGFIFDGTGFIKVYPNMEGLAFIAARSLVKQLTACLESLICPYDHMSDAALEAAALAFLGKELGPVFVREISAARRLLKKAKAAA